MIYIVGLSHSVQAIKLPDPHTPGHDKFEKLLRNAISEFNPDFVAEEDSKEALARRNAISIPKVVADELGTHHEFCDPNSTERDAIGYLELGVIHQSVLDQSPSISPAESLVRSRAIEMAVYDPKRERFWLEHLPFHRGKDGIFVCGDAHVESFGALLASEGVKSKVHHREIGMDEAEKAELTKARLYLVAHPELRNWRP